MVDDTGYGVGISVLKSFFKMEMEISFESQRHIRFHVCESYIFYKRLNNTTFIILGLYVQVKNQRLGEKLLLFSLLVLREWYPLIRTVYVDDMSSNASSIRHNIYRNFGFRCLMKARPKNAHEFWLTGPEKKLVLNSLFTRYYLPKMIDKLTKTPFYY